MLKKNRYSNFIIVVVVIVIVLTMFMMPCNYFRRPPTGKSTLVHNLISCCPCFLLSIPFFSFLHARHHLLYNAPRLIEGIVYG